MSGEMVKDDLTVCSVVYNDRNTKLFDLMVGSILKFTHPTPKFIICDNGGNDLEAYKSVPNFTIISNADSKYRGSAQHGESLNKVFSLSSTKRTAIIESDCVVLNQGWDNLNFPKYKMLASKKGEQTKQPYYHVCFLVFSTPLLKHGNMDFRPGKGSLITRPYKMWEDVGWRLREKVRPDEILNVDFIDCKSGKGQFFNSEFQSDEFWLNGLPIIAHFGRGSNLGGKAVRYGFKSNKSQLEEWKKIAWRILE